MYDTVGQTGGRPGRERDQLPPPRWRSATPPGRSATPPRPSRTPGPGQSSPVEPGEAKDGIRRPKVMDARGTRSAGFPRHLGIHSGGMVDLRPAGQTRSARSNRARYPTESVVRSGQGRLRRGRNW